MQDGSCIMPVSYTHLDVYKRQITDSTRKLALWSVVSAEKADCYRKVTVEHVGKPTTDNLLNVRSKVISG